MATKLINVVVVGGGIAGLTAAAELAALQNVNVTLVEAADYLGGRVKQVKPFEGCNWMDLGGEFIHGEQTSIMKNATELGWEYEDLGLHENSRSQCYVFCKDSLVTLDKSNSMAVEARYHMEMFEEKGRKIRKSFSQVMLKCEPLFTKISPRSDEESQEQTESKLESVRQKDVSLEDYLGQLRNLSEECKSLIDVLYCQTEGNDLSRIGMLEFSRMSETWPYGSKNFRLKQSYKVLLDHMISKCSSVNIKLNWQVKEVNWEEAKQRVISKSNDILLCDYVVIAVPLTVLKDGDIRFRPGFSNSKLQALENMEMRNGCKMFCSFSQRFLLSENADVYYTSYGPFKQIWNESSYKVDGQQIHVLCGFSTGSAADDAANCDSVLLKDQFLVELDILFRTPERQNPATESFVDYFFYDWGSNPYIRGCYSSPVLKSYGLAEKLAEPIGGKLFFAGEATNAQGASSVESAIDSGKRVAKEILQVCGW